VLSALALLAMFALGLGIPIAFILVIVPQLLPYAIIFYLICCIVMFVESYKRNKSLTMAIVGAPLILGCLVVTLVFYFFASVPSFFQKIYIATLKGTVRIRAAQPHTSITTQKQFDHLGAGYRFLLSGEIDKNTTGRKGKIIVRLSYMYLGEDIGWIRTPKTPAFFPQKISLDTGKDIVEFKSPPVSYPQEDYISIRQTTKSKYRYSSSRKGNQKHETVELNVPPRPDLPVDLPIGSRHEWELRVGDELMIEGQIKLQYRVYQTERRIKYSKLEVVNPREWTIYAPDEDDINVATRHREYDLFLQHNAEPVITVETMAEFMALDPGQRFIVHGHIDEDNEMLWQDYVFYKPGPVYRWSHNWSNRSNFETIGKQKVKISFYDGSYEFDLTIPHQLYGVHEKRMQRFTSNSYKIQLPKLDKPTITKGLQDEVRAYQVLKVRDRVIVHACKITDHVNENIPTDTPVFGVEKIIVDTKRDWVLYSKDERSPAEDAWKKKQSEANQKQRAKHFRTSNAAKQLRKNLGLPPVSPSRYRQLDTSRFGKITHQTDDKIARSNNNRTSDTQNRLNRIQTTKQDQESDPKPKSPFTRNEEKDNTDS